ncbi:hypothetical protein KPH14_010185 [Odynerus spinipes]|uniref:Uncharacterized protein n=1 Tax=Odynerus spinipes TaxID=1348599 RepID=A0AAD9VSL8_9HYME|nr:hypothetical protein KPH14_010185 [Odynerus spinipes]
MQAKNTVESLTFKNTRQLDSFNKDIQTFKPLFPPFKQKSLGVVVDGDKQQEGKEGEELQERKPFELYDADYQEWEGSLEEETDEMDYQGWWEDSEKEKKLWWLKECDILASITDEEDIDEDYTETTKPLLAHPLTIPYARTPKPRFVSTDENVKYILETLPRRPPSPVRHVLPLRFDLRAAMEGLREEKSRENEIRNYLRESKNRISGELMQMLEDGVEADKMIGSLVLQLILEEVVLTIDFVDHGIDVHTFLTIATTMALRELKISCPSEPSYSSLDENWESFFPRHDDDIEDDSKGIKRKSKRNWSELRSALRRVRTPRLRDSDLLHHCLPWHLMLPSHERGHTAGRFYANLRDRIDKILGNSHTELARAYVPDVTCYHLKEYFPSAFRDTLDKRTILQSQPEVSFCWKPTVRDIVELPFRLFSFV